MTLGSDYTYEPFDHELAIAGNPTAVLVATNTYKLVEKFEVRPSEYAINYPYRVLIEGAYYNFSRNGDGETTGQTIWMAIGNIDSDGATPGDTQTKTDQGTGTTHYYALTNLNYRESVALQTLNALITHIPNPFGYNTATVKLLISKAFEFAVEFTNQALSLRVDNAELDPDTGEVVPDATDVVTALNSIITKLNDLNTTETAVKQALDGTTSNGVAAKVSTIATKSAGLDNLADIKTNIATVGTNVQTGDSNIVNAINNIGVGQQLSSIASAVNIVDGKVDIVDGKVDDIKTTVDDIDTKVTPSSPSA